MNRLELLESLVGTGGMVCEVGVHMGDFAAELLEGLDPAELHLVDAWRFIPGEYERDPMNRRGRDFERFYRRAVSRFAHNNGVFIHRSLSPRAATRFEDEYFDLVYLDADHTYNAVRADLDAWWPKVRKGGGVLAGHDYGVQRAWIDVKDAVDDWVEILKIPAVHVSDDPLPSWAVVRL